MADTVTEIQPTQNRFAIDVFDVGDSFFDLGGLTFGDVFTDSLSANGVVDVTDARAMTLPAGALVRVILTDPADAGLTDEGRQDFTIRDFQVAPEGDILFTGPATVTHSTQNGQQVATFNTADQDSRDFLLFAGFPDGFENAGWQPFELPYRVEIVSGSNASPTPVIPLTEVVLTQANQPLQGDVTAGFVDTPENPYPSGIDINFFDSFAFTTIADSPVSVGLNPYDQDKIQTSGQFDYATLDLDVYEQQDDGSLTLSNSVDLVWSFVEQLDLTVVDAHPAALRFTDDERDVFLNPDETFVLQLDADKTYQLRLSGAKFDSERASEAAQLSLNYDLTFVPGSISADGPEVRELPGGVSTAAAQVLVGSGAVPVDPFDFFDLPAVEQVAAVYVGYFGRAPDAGGRDFWVADLNDGVSQGQSPAATAQEMASGFRFSGEAQGIYPFLDPAVSHGASEAQIDAFVGDVFDNLFNRTPDAAGLDFWTGQIQERLGSNLTIGNIIVDVMTGAAGDDVTTLQNKIEVANAYTDMASPFDAGESIQLIGSVDTTQASVDQALAQIG